MRLDKLECQLRVHERSKRHIDDQAQHQLAEQIADADARIGRLIDALEAGLNADEVHVRLAKLQEDKEKAQIQLRALTPHPIDSNAPDATELLAQIPT